MHTITAKISEVTHERLERLASLTDRKKSYLVRQALEGYLEDMEDASVARAQLLGVKDEDLIALEDIEKRYGLDG